jgi:hypothetical protein
MHAKVIFLIGVASALFITACSNDSASIGREANHQNAVSDRKPDSAEPVDAAGRTPDNAGKCIAGACADQSPPTSP